jgi:hypothetical protein
MSKVKIQGSASGSGVLTIQAPTTSTDRTITLPDTTGTLLDENSSVPAANLTGTVADARISALTASKLTGALPAISAANLTAIPAANVTGTLPAIDGSNLTGISSAAGSSHFHAIFSSSQWNSYAGGNKIGFDNTFRNVGSDFSTSNNRYVAPADGVYYFYYLIYSALNDASNGFTFRKNGATTDLVDRNQQVTTFDEHNAGDHVQTGTLVVNLSANDYIEIYSTTQSDLYTGHSNWGGFRIS